MNDSNSSATKRVRSIKSAIVTSLASKFGTAILQLVSMPIAAQVMGKQEFGLYATISVTISLVILMELGVGPALVQGISTAVAKKDRKKEIKYYGTSLAMIICFSMLGALILGLVIALVPIKTLFGAEYAGLEGPMLKGLWVGLIIFTLEIIMCHSDRAREGYMETNITNLYMAVGNVGAAVLIAIGIKFLPEVWFLLLAVFGMNVLMKICNMAALLKKRPWLIPGRNSFSKDVFSHVLKDGMAFSVSYALTILVEFNLCALMLGRASGPGEVALFHVFTSVTLILNGIIIMVTTPVWPAVVDAYEAKDVKWINRAAMNLYRYVAFVGIGALVGATLLGPFILPKWYGDEFQASALLFSAWGMFFLANAWRRGNHVLTVAVGLVKKSALFTLVECALAALFAYIGMITFGMPGLFFGLSLAIFSVSGWGFPYLFWSKVRESNPSTPEEGSATLQPEKA